MKRTIILRTIRATIVCLGPLTFGVGPEGQDVRCLTVDRVADDGSTKLERLGLFLVGQDAHCATLKLGQVMQITYEVSVKQGRVVRTIVKS